MLGRHSIQTRPSWAQGVCGGTWLAAPPASECSSLKLQTQKAAEGSKRNILPFQCCKLICMTIVLSLDTFNTEESNLPEWLRYDHFHRKMINQFYRFSYSENNKERKPNKSFPIGSFSGWPWWHTGLTWQPASPSKSSRWRCGCPAPNPASCLCSWERSTDSLILRAHATHVGDQDGWSGLSGTPPSTVATWERSTG